MARPPVNLTSGAGYHTIATRTNLSNGDETIDVDAVGTTPGYQFIDQCSGVTRPRPKGWMNPTGYEMLQKSINYSKGTMEATRSVWPYKYLQRISGGLGGALFDLNKYDEAITEDAAWSIMSEVSNAALISALGKLKGNKINLGVAYGERKQTAKLVGDTAIRLVTSLRALRTGDIKTAARSLGIAGKPGKPKGSTIPQKWLELQYGWKPLLNDVHGVVKALSDRTASDWRVTVKGRNKRTVSRKASYDASSPNYPWNVSARIELSAQCRIDAIPRESLVRNFEELGILNPLHVGWELVPFSFVVDWFYPIGDYLNSLDAMVGFSPDTWTCTSSLMRGMWTLSGGSKTWQPNDQKYSTQASGSKRVVRLSRGASQGYQIPRPPVIQNPVSLGHMANGLSLLAQVFGHKGRGA